MNPESAVQTPIHTDKRGFSMACASVPSDLLGEKAPGASRVQAEAFGCAPRRPSSVFRLNRLVLLILLLATSTVRAFADAGTAAGDDRIVPPSGRPEQGPPAATRPESLTAAEVLEKILARAEEEVAARREFEQTHAYVVEKTTERRDAANHLLERKVEREEHDPRRVPDHDGDKGPGYRQKDFKVNQAMLDRYRITLTGVEAVNGRPAWALAFEPADPPPPVHDLKERFLSQVAGTVWVDQADCTMARLELRLVKPVNVIGGLVGAVKACQVFLQRERASEGLWYNSEMRWRLEGRKLLVTTVMLYDERRGEVRRVVDPSPSQSRPLPAETAGLSGE
ncbi:MAG: hypothetical protein H7A46_24550 [Verrucomicrobiales bacterium]|nr:hypothetical protein [Verrucomicrobiales bacterium]